MTPTTVDLTVESIAVGGDGVGRTASGQVVFLARTAPGDRVRAELFERRKRWARGRVVEIYEKGPDRVEPACGYFDECGGCQLQHLGAAAQAAWLRRAVSDTLARIGGAEVPVGRVISGARKLGYRNRVTFSLRRDGARVTAGYRAVRGGRLIDVERCPLAEPAVQEAWAGLRAAWGPGARHLPAGAELRITVRASVDGEVGLLVSGGYGGAPDPAPIERGVPRLATYWWTRADGTRERLAGTDTLADRWEGVELSLWPEAFLQVNREVSARIDAHLDAGLGGVEGLTILDLYAGVGLRAIRWAAAGASVVAVESGADAARTGRAAASRLGTRAPRLIEGTVEAALPGLGPADVIVVNPPRAGLGLQAAERLREVAASRLVYVSCDPATLARDVSRLRGWWTPERAQPFDAFPQTGHVETVLWLSRAGRGDAAVDGTEGR